jgi:hypothetical protein
MSFTLFLSNDPDHRLLSNDKKAFNTTRLRSSNFVCSNLKGLIPCLEFSIEIESNSLMYNPNKVIRDRFFPVKIGKFSVKSII